MSVKSVMGQLTSQLQVDFSIIAVGVLDCQSLDDRFQHFQTTIFFSTIAIVSLDVLSLFGPYSDHYSQTAIDILNHSDRHFRSPIDNLNLSMTNQ